LEGTKITLLFKDIPWYSDVYLNRMDINTCFLKLTLIGKMVNSQLWNTTECWQKRS